MRVHLKYNGNIVRDTCECMFIKLKNIACASQFNMVVAKLCQMSNHVGY